MSFAKIPTGPSQRFECARKTWPARIRAARIRDRTQREGSLLARTIRSELRTGLAIFRAMLLLGTPAVRLNRCSRLPVNMHVPNDEVISHTVAGRDLPHHLVVIVDLEGPGSSRGAW